ncbi:transcription cofactor HES-6 isoform X1 [Rhinichthys klamathensis goyatoka]|uniref:transcription cofactor HES-6 isoform X1 n=1 Tax=Rhinichthys klamathensis goyatoka TaxID=3034132 RepID=UPI0024B6130D|nr:transcription cofactor HES-6 isoform X1 [Rhinichthys klamathensis goyatoka]
MSLFNRPLYTVYVVLVSADFCLELNPPTICPPFRRPLSGLNCSNMAPASRSNSHEEDYYGIKDRKTRKPLVEKKRRARINESLQELRLLLADPDAQVKMENAEVLEMTVKRVESILQNKATEADSVNREANERFAAGYIQCMHEVHTFVSSCPGIDATIAAELLNHLLQCMPLNDEDRFQDILSDLMTDSSNGDRSTSSALSPAPSTTSSSSDDLCSDLDETDTEQSRISVDARDQAPSMYLSKAIWRPW